jgi:hypothetical protein
MSLLDALLQRIAAVQSNGTAVQFFETLNFGSGFTVTPDVTNQRLNVTGSGGGGGFPSTPSAGDLVYYNGTAWVALAPGSLGQVLMQGSSSTPTWSTISQGTIQLGAYASRPVAGTAGRVYMPTDGGIQFVDNGAAWQPILDGTLGTQPPATGTFTQSHFTTGTTAADSNGAVRLANVNGVAADQFQSLLVSGVAPSTAYTLTVSFRALIALIATSEFSNVGICITDGTKFEGMRIGYLDTIQVVQYNTYNSFNQNLNSSVMPWPGGGARMWMKLKNVNGGNRTWSFSVDGVNYYTLITEAAGTFMTETNVGFFINTAAGNTQTTQGILESWSLTFP